MVRGCDRLHPCCCTSDEPSVMAQQPHLHVFFANIGGDAATRIPHCILAYPGRDVYIFAETMCTATTAQQLVCHGFTSFHCVRDAPASGRPHGGLTVLLRDSSPWVGSMAGPRHVWRSAYVGYMFLELPSHQLCICAAYFSPSSSTLYRHGDLHERPVTAFLDALHHVVHTKRLRALVFGDFNVRIGLLHDDLVTPADLALPPGVAFLSHTLLQHQTCVSIPQLRQSVDTHIPDPACAREFLKGLAVARCVVLNGRHPGDHTGAATFSRPHALGPTRSSVVDLAVASSSLYAHISSFRVGSFDNQASADHCPLLLSLHVPPAAHNRVADNSAKAPRQPRAWRPVGPDQVDAFCSALQRISPHLAALFESMVHGHISVHHAIDRIHELLKQCIAESRAATHNRSLQQPQQPAAQGAPWFNGECHALKQRFLDAWSRHLQHPLDPNLHAAGLTARKRYKHGLLRAKQAYKQQQQMRHLSVFFGRRQSDFWRVFLGRNTQHACLPIDDVHEWTVWFRGLMGHVDLVAGDNDGPRNNSMSAAAIADVAEVKTRLHNVGLRDALSMAALNDEVTTTEVIQIVKSLPPGRAPDGFGLTCELFKLAVTPIMVGDSAAGTTSREGGSANLCCLPLVQCLTHIINSLPDEQHLPPQLAISTLTPVPKASQPQAPLDKDRYRGISVSSVLSKIVDKLLAQRLDAAVEATTARSPTQCGFRKGMGTLDAMFAMHHLIQRARAEGKYLYVVFVDFKKAFDTVSRQALLDRCRQLGVHGRFLQVLELLYSRVQQRVRVAGRLGDLFDTYTGTKQGSELSPLLFGLFMDILHELILMEFPGCGPILAGMSVPDIAFADDVALLALNDADRAQRLLDCLGIFCAIFNMQVNLGPVDKTCCVVFRRRGCAIPDGLHLTFNGVPVPIAEQYKHLGVILHATMGTSVAMEALASSAERAMYAMLRKCRQHCITQFDFKCRLFDFLVAPILSYGCHVWAPELFQPVIHRLALAARYAVNVRAWELPLPFLTADDVHMTFLRSMAGVGSGCSADVILRDFARLPIMFHWVQLAARWFKRTASKPACLAHHALLADLALLIRRRHTVDAGFVSDACKQCWSYYFFATMTDLDVIHQSKWDIDRDPTLTVERLLALSSSIDEKMVVSRLRRLLLVRWNGLWHDPALPNAPSGRFERCVHAAWILPLPRVVNDRLVTESPPHLKLCAPFKLLQCLAKFRLGWHHLSVMTGRHRRPRIPRHERVCPLCSPGCLFEHGRRSNDSAVEDVRHFLLHCPAYNHLRQTFGDVFYGYPRSDIHVAEEIGGDGWLLVRLFHTADMHHQLRFARCIFLMSLYRKECMSLMARAPVATATSQVTQQLQRNVSLDPLAVQLCTQLPESLYDWD